MRQSAQFGSSLLDVLLLTYISCTRHNYVIRNIENMYIYKNFNETFYLCLKILIQIQTSSFLLFSFFSIRAAAIFLVLLSDIYKIYDFVFLNIEIFLSLIIIFHLNNNNNIERNIAIRKLTIKIITVFINSHLKIQLYCTMTIQNILFSIIIISNKILPFEKLQ